MVRTPSFDKNGLKKGAWSPEEDNKLRAYIQRYGHWNWRELPKYAGLSRCGKSCRLRWMNYLSPDVKRGNYTKEEENIIIELHEKLGNKWSVIAAELKGRTDNGIKNYWHTHLKKRLNKKPKQANIGTSQPEFNQSESEANPSPESAPADASNASAQSTHLERSLSTEFSSLTTSEYSFSGDINWFGKEGSNGDFWTEPFLTDTDVNEFDWFGEEGSNGDFWTEPFPHDTEVNEFDSVLVGGVFVDPFCSYYDDGSDLLY